MRLPSLIAAMILFPTVAFAGSPVAIVEDVAAKNAGVEFMDYVEAGKIIALGDKGRLVIGYLHSCLRETITGGKVTVGREKSRVSGGKVTRERVECDGGKLLLSQEQAGKSAVVVFRRPPPVGGATRAAHRVYSTTPYIQLQTGTGTVEIERLDHPSKVLRLEARNGGVDLAQQHISLRSGGLYRVRAAGKEVVFQVDVLARPGGSLLGRLVSF